MKADKRSRAGKPPLDAPAPPEASDAAVFRDAMRNVRPLRVTSPAPPPPPKPRPRAAFRRRDEAAVLAESLQPQGGDCYMEDGEFVSFRRSGVQDSVLRKLRGGQFRIEAEIDLHGLTVAQAKEALREFLRDMQRERVRCVRIIHGKGRRSGHQGPVLKPAVQLALQKVDAVVAYASARAVDGGTGALYVLLRWG